MEKIISDMKKLVDTLYAGQEKILVPGEGPKGARIMLIGEAPGEQETLQLRPFVGRAGKTLEEYMDMTGLRREEMYVTNTVKFRPTKISKAEQTVNRPPTTEEIRLFLPFLKREIATIEPRLIVTLGNVPLKALTDGKYVIGDVHGGVMEIGEMRIFPMYHPASLIYNHSLVGVYGEDMAKLSDLIKNDIRFN